MRPLAAHRPGRSHQCYCSRFPGHPNRNTRQSAQASFLFALEFVHPIRAFLMTIACDERVMLELGAQALAVPNLLSKKSSWLCTSPDRSLTNFSVWVVPRSSSLFQHITAILHSNVCSQLAHDRDWCQRRNELLSSICRHGLLEHEESHHSVHANDSSREIQNLHDLGCADSTTRRNHVGRSHIHGHQAVPLEKSIAPS